MTFTYDPHADAAFLYFADGPPDSVARTEPCDVEINRGAVILLFDPDDRLIGLEILGVPRVLTDEAVARAERGSHRD